MIVLSIQRKAEGILGIIMQAAALTIGAALIVAGVMHPDAVSYVFMAVWGRR